MTRCPFSLSRLVKVTDTGQVVYKAEKQACRAFPDPRGDGLESAAKRNFQILPPLDFLAEFTDPPQGDVIEKTLRHCGLWRGSAPRPPPDVAGLVHDLDGCFSDSPTGSSD